MIKIHKFDLLNWIEERVVKRSKGAVSQRRRERRERREIGERERREKGERSEGKQKIS